MSIPKDLKYTEEHEWLRREGANAVIGITDHAQEALGDIVFVELPAVGTKIERGKTFGTVESVKAVSDLFAPVSGEVLEVNEALASGPEIVNAEPYDKAWMVKVKVTRPAEIDALMDAAAYGRHVEAGK